VSAASGASAEDIAARLNALGLTARVTEHARHVVIEAEVPEALPAERWREALQAVEEADRFGLLANSLNGRTLWAAVREETPATGEVRGPGSQR
jgi:alkylhydroperoxidase family enzyme